MIIRCYRKIGIDLQKEVHEDMVGEFPALSAIVGAPRTRLPTSTTAASPISSASSNARAKRSLASREPADYRPGDIVIWSLANADKHIGIVVPGPGNRAGEAWVVHNMGTGMKWEGVLFDFKVEAHFRYPAAAESAAPQAKATAEAPER